MIRTAGIPRQYSDYPDEFITCFKFLRELQKSINYVTCKGGGGGRQSVTRGGGIQNFVTSHLKNTKVSQ